MRSVRAHAVGDRITRTFASERGDSKSTRSRWQSHTHIRIVRGDIGSTAYFACQRRDCERRDSATCLLRKLNAHSARGRRLWDDNTQRQYYIPRVREAMGDGR